MDQVKGKLQVGFAPVRLKRKPRAKSLPPLFRVVMAQRGRGARSTAQPGWLEAYVVHDHSDADGRTDR